MSYVTLVDTEDGQKSEVLRPVWRTLPPPFPGTPLSVWIESVRIWSPVQISSHTWHWPQKPDRRKSRWELMQTAGLSTEHTDTKHRPDLHHVADRGSEGACRRCYSGPAGERLCPGSGPVRTRCLGAAAAPYPGSAGSATDWTGRPASPGPKRGGTLHLHTDARNENSDNNQLYNLGAVRSWRHPLTWYFKWYFRCFRSNITLCSNVSEEEQIGPGGLNGPRGGGIITLSNM